MTDWSRLPMTGVVSLRPGELVMGLDWSGDIKWTEGGTAIIDGEKADIAPLELQKPGANAAIMPPQRCLDTLEVE